jgi:heme exporter protein A
MLEANQLSCSRDGNLLFSGLTFHVAKNDIIQVAGRNGAGKTSLLRILVGLARADAGQVLWQGEPLARSGELWRSNLLWLGHQSGVKASMTADENLHFYHSKSAQAARWQALEMLGLVGYEDVPVAQLSAGQQRRVALARLWLTQASVWILDEPFTALDVVGIETLTSRIEQHAMQGGSVILTTHQPLRALSTPVRTLHLTVQDNDA